MKNGGKRHGAGRPLGTANIKTREIADKRAADGKITPLEVVLDNMRFYHQGAAELVAKLIGAGVPEAEPAAEGDQPHTNVIEAIGQVLGLRKAADEEAARAAPYCHVRLAPAIDSDGGQGEDEVPLAERLQAYQRRDDIKAAGEKVVELKRQGEE